jgi:hypothetical protein
LLLLICEANSQLICQKISSLTGSIIYPSDYIIILQISPVNNNVSKPGFSSSPPPGSLQAQMMGSASFGQTTTPLSSHSASSFPRQQFASSGMYGWY